MDNGEQSRLSFQRDLPSVKRIVVNHCDPSNSLLNRIPEDVTTFARAFTPHYTVFISVKSHPIVQSPPHPKDLYRLDRASQWTLAQKGWMRDIIVPPKEDITGIVGTYLKTGRKKKYLFRPQKDLYYLRYELYEKFHFDGPEKIPFVCPHNTCDIEFKNAAEWRGHSNRYWDHERSFGFGIDISSNYTSKLPTEIEDILHAKELEIDKSMKDASFKEIQLEESWGEEGSEQRRLYEEQFLAQLKNDPLCKSHGSRFLRALRHDWDQLVLDWSF